LKKKAVVKKKVVVKTAAAKGSSGKQGVAKGSQRPTTRADA
jgi:hypothetical protein